MDKSGLFFLSIGVGTAIIYILDLLISFSFDEKFNFIEEDNNLFDISPV